MTDPQHSLSMTILDHPKGCAAAVTMFFQSLTV
jgi:hypothetical protein